MCLRWWGISLGNEVPALSGAGYPARGVVVVMVRRRALKKSFAIRTESVTAGTNQKSATAWRLWTNIRVLYVVA